MNRDPELTCEYPIWLSKEHKILEPVFCEAFLREHPMLCIQGRFYKMDGIVTDESGLKKDIYDKISPWLDAKVARKVDELFNALRMAAYSEPMELENDRIHVANGAFFLEKHTAATA